MPTDTRPADEARELVGGVAHGGDRGQRGARVRQHGLPGRGGTDPARRAVEQHVPQLALEARDLRADARLGDVLARGGPREPALLGDGDEVAQLVQLHKHQL